MKKRRKIFQRAAALLCCILVLPSLVAVPASAEEMSNFMDLVDAGYFSTRHKVTPDQGNINFSFEDPTLIRYIDFVFTRSGTAPDRLYIVSATDGSRQQLKVESLGNYVYRAYGEVSVKISYDFSLFFETTGTTWIYPYTCRVSFNIRSAFPDIGRLTVNDYLGELTDWYMDSPSSPLYSWFRYPATLDNNYICEYQSGIYFENWRKYDYLDVYLTLADASISSIACSMGASYVPFEISVIGDIDLFDWEVNETGGVVRYFPSGLENYMYVNLRLDLTELFRSDASDLGIMISGQYSTDSANICLYSVTGYVSNDISDTDTLWIKMKKFFTDLFGKDDPAAEQAQQTQQQVDQEINLQIVQAMEDWDANIQYAETGFTSGLALVTPSVAWISSLATRIFENLQGFGAVYIMVGFMSVIMLLLSKSGIAAKISNNIRSSSGGKSGGK